MIEAVVTIAIVVCTAVGILCFIWGHCIGWRDGVHFASHRGIP